MTVIKSIVDTPWLHVRLYSHQIQQCDGFVFICALNHTVQCSAIISLVFCYFYLPLPLVFVKMNRKINKSDFIFNIIKQRERNVFPFSS